MENRDELKKNPKTQFLSSEYERLKKEKDGVLSVSRDDPKMTELAKDELASLETQMKGVEDKIKSILASEVEEEEFPNHVLLEAQVFERAPVVYGFALR